MAGAYPRSTEPPNLEDAPSGGGLAVRLSCGRFASEVELPGVSGTEVRALLAAVTSLITAADARGVIPRLTQRLGELESGLIPRGNSNPGGGLKNRNQNQQVSQHAPVPGQARAAENAWDSEVRAGGAAGPNELQRSGTGGNGGGGGEVTYGADFPVLGRPSAGQQPRAQASVSARPKTGPSYVSALRKGTTAARTAAMVRFLPDVAPMAGTTETTLTFVWVRNVRPRTTRGQVPNMRDFRNIFAESLGCRREDFIFANYEGRDVLFVVTMGGANYLKALLDKPVEQWPESARWLRSHPQVSLHFEFDRFSGHFLSPGQTEGLSDHESSVKAAVIHWRRLHRIERILLERYRSGPRHLRTAVSKFFDAERSLVLTSSFKGELERLGMLEGPAPRVSPGERGATGGPEDMLLERVPIDSSTPESTVLRSSRSGGMTMTGQPCQKRIRTDSPGSKGEKDD